MKVNIKMVKGMTEEFIFFLIEVDMNEPATKQKGVQEGYGTYFFSHKDYEGDIYTYE